MVLDDETNSRILPNHEFSWEYEALVYEFNIGIFLIASFVITDGLSDENKLEAIPPIIPNNIVKLASKKLLFFKNSISIP